MAKGDFLRKFRRWLDGEEYSEQIGPSQPADRSQAFITAIARDLASLLEREKFTPPGGPTYVPREYVVFLNPEDNAEWVGNRRDALVNGVRRALQQHAEEIAEGKLNTNRLSVELRIDPSLRRNQFRAKAIWEDMERTVPVDRRPAGHEDEDEITIFSDDDEADETLLPLFTVKVTQETTAASATYKFYKRTITVGRGSKTKPVDIQLENDKEISRLLASLELRDDAFLLTRLGRSRLIANETRVEENGIVTLRPNERVKIGDYTLTVDLLDG